MPAPPSKTRPRIPRPCVPDDGDGLTLPRDSHLPRSFATASLTPVCPT
jgi:hypothetical protein